MEDILLALIFTLEVLKLSNCKSNFQLGSHNCWVGGVIEHGPWTQGRDAERREVDRHEIDPMR